MSIQFRSRIKSAIDYSNELNSYGVCCDSIGGKSIKSFYECFTENGYFIGGISGGIDSVTCPNPEIELGCCCSCSYVTDGGFAQMDPYPPTEPYLSSGIRSNISKCECSRLKGKWTSGECPSSLTNTNLDPLCKSNNIDVRYPRSCCHLGFDEQTGWPTSIECTDVCNSSDCADLSTPEYPSVFGTTTRCFTRLLTDDTIPSVSCIENPLRLISTSSSLYNGLDIGSCYVLEDNDGELQYNCNLTPEILCPEYWIQKQDSDEAFCDNKFKPSNPVKVNGSYSVQTMLESDFNLLGLTTGDEFQGGKFIGIFKPSKLNTESSVVYGNINFGNPTLGKFNSDDVGGNNSKWALIVDETRYIVPFLLKNEYDIHYQTSLWDGYYNTYGNNALFNGIRTNLTNTIKYTNRKGFIDYYLPSIYELHFYSSYLFSSGVTAKGNLISSSMFDTKYLNVNRSQTSIKNQKFIYGQVINDGYDINYKTVLINKYNVETAIFMRRIVLQ